jgi:hypothetical protein
MERPALAIGLLWRKNFCIAKKPLDAPENRAIIYSAMQNNPVEFAGAKCAHKR